MRFKRNGLANFCLGCICGYGVSNAFDADPLLGSLIVFGIAGSIFCVYAYPVD